MKTPSPYWSSLGRWCALPASSIARGCKVELNLDLPEHVHRRFEEPDPDDVIGLLGPCAGLVDRHIRDPSSMGIGTGGDHARGLGRRWSGNIARALIQSGARAELAMGVLPTCRLAWLQALFLAYLAIAFASPLFVLSWSSQGPARNPGRGCRNRPAGPARRKSSQTRLPSNRHLRADLDHTAGWDLEEVGRVRGRLGEADEQLVLP